MWLNILMKLVARNKKAEYEYELYDRFEAGLSLVGTEVKSLRAGRCSLTGAFVRIEGGQAYIYNMNIPEYKFGNIFNHDPLRKRKLLLHKREIDKIAGAISRRGFTCIPTKIYFKDGWAKVEIALARGKTKRDKRQTIKKQEELRRIKKVFGGRVKV